ncbi:DUF7261 family protein [Haloarcula salina]|uniref:DUF7261 family protein n=1 Tax=Haloarcula salina TaxID=1429914 RepID=UPI003C6FE902
MADLAGRERGQIILIAAFALAVTFVSLALIVNSAIFTENLASRGETAGGDGALDARAMVETSVERSVAAANRYNHSAPEAAVERDVRAASRQRGKQQALTGGLVNTSNPHDYHYGSRIAMNDSGGGNFTANGLSGGASDWQLVEGVDENGRPHAVRAFEMEIKKGGALDSTDLDPLSGRFTVVVNNTGSPSRQWTVTLWREDLNPDRIHVRTERPGGAARECAKTIPADEFAVSLTDGTVDGRPCHALGYDQAADTYFGYGAGVSTPYNVSFQNGDQVKGNYSFVTANSPATTTLDSGPSAGPAPYMTSAVYEVEVAFTYANPSINYTTQIRVAPGEPDG